MTLLLRLLVEDADAFSRLCLLLVLLVLLVLILLALDVLKAMLSTILLLFFVRLVRQVYKALYLSHSLSLHDCLYLSSMSLLASMWCFFC
jgi:hypothetical protein